ncbi:hypothetical protein OSCI_640006 [Kamptonema sp. PCC 6506]|nr:hypothetical protein OSCI_640006 [Kamptonema sp. PCC 6506]
MNLEDDKLLVYRIKAQKPGFYENTSFLPADSAKNPVSLVQRVSSENIHIEANHFI